MKNILLLSFGLILWAGPAFAESKTFVLSYGTRPCAISPESMHCQRVQNEVSEEIELQLSGKTWTKLVVANLIPELPYEFYIAVYANQKEDRIEANAWLMSAKDGWDLGRAQASAKTYDELNELKVGSSQVRVSETGAYQLFVTLKPKR